MLNKNKLIDILSDGEFHSGQALADALGVSRTAVWKAVKQLIDSGFPLETERGKGYRLPGGLALLSESVLVQGLEKLPYKIQLTFQHILESTNDTLLSHSLGDNDYHVCVAEQQTAGRGRRGKQWISPYGQNIYLSIAFSMHKPASQLGGLSLIVGLAAAKVLKQIGVSDAMIKWPNDIWVSQQKLAGILIDLRGEGMEDWYVVAGIGLNAAMKEVDIDQPWVDLSSLGISCDRNTLVGLLVAELINHFEGFKQFGFGRFLTEWDLYDCLRGLELVDQQGKELGVAAGIDVQGQLLVKDASGDLVAINSGEVSVRPHANRA